MLDFPRHQLGRIRHAFSRSASLRARSSLFGSRAKQSLHFSLICFKFCKSSYGVITLHVFEQFSQVPYSPVGVLAGHPLQHSF